MAAITCVEIRIWGFHCPECGFGHQELGHLAADQEIHCVVCMDEDGRYVRLQRWTEMEPVPDQPAVRAA